MKIKHALLILAILLLIVCLPIRTAILKEHVAATDAQPAQTATDTQPAQTATGGIRAQDDFYHYVNGEQLSQVKFGLSDYEWSNMANIAKEVRTTMKDYVKDCLNHMDEYETSDPRYQVAALYSTLMDQAKRDETGLTPLVPYLDQLDDAASVTDYLVALVRLARELGTNSLFEITVCDNPRDTSQNIGYIGQPDLGLGKEYYEDEASVQVVTLYTQMMSKLFRQTGMTPEESDETAGKVLELMKEMAAIAKEDIELMQNEEDIQEYSMDELVALFSNIDVMALMEQLGYGNCDTFLVANPELCQKINALLTEDNLELLKSYTKLITLYDMCSLLSQDLTNIVDEFNFAAGMNSSNTAEDAAYDIVAAIFGDALGQKYARDHCSEETRRAVAEMTKKIIAVYMQRIQNSDWLEADTRSAALRKLETLKVQIGAPAQIPMPYANVALVPAAQGGSTFENCQKLSAALYEYSISTLGAADHQENWSMLPQEANAAYSPTDNAITVPAAILQAPYYAQENTFAENMGGVGTIIAHELTHAFDSIGAKYDENGNLHDWWTANDAEEFAGKVQKTIDYFNQVDTHFGKVDGARTASENIADMGAVACALEAIGDDPEAQREYFIAYAKSLAYAANEDYAYYLYQVDEHAPDDVRVNAIVSLNEQFYRVFDVHPGDGMYVEPEMRVAIW